MINLNRSEVYTIKANDKNLKHHNNKLSTRLLENSTDINTAH